MSERTKRLNYLNPCYVGKKIEKELILNRISNEDNEIFRKFVNSVIIKYVIKPQKIGLKEYKTDQEDYSEIQIIEININNYRAIRDVYSILVSIIPYPIFAIFKYEDDVAFASTYGSKINSKNHSANTKGNINITYLMNATSIDFTSFIPMEEENLKGFYDYINFYIHLDIFHESWKSLDRIMTVLDLIFEINDKKHIEEELLKYCGYKYKHPEKRWKSKLDKYGEYGNYKKMIEVHRLWNYLLYYSPIRRKINNFLEDKDYITSWEELDTYCRRYINNFEDDEICDKNMDESEDDIYEATY